MARKKKPSRKYTPRDEIRYNNSKKAAGHPHYVFGEKDSFYYSLGFTTHPKKGFPTYELQDIPNPNCRRKNYVQRKVFKQNKRVYGKIISGWNFSSDDMSILRRIIKNYKRSLKRK